MRNEIIRIYRQHAATALAIGAGAVLVITVVAPLFSAIAGALYTLNSALGG